MAVTIKRNQIPFLANFMKFWEETLIKGLLNNSNDYLNKDL